MEPGASIPDVAQPNHLAFSGLWRRCCALYVRLEDLDS